MIGRAYVAPAGRFDEAIAPDGSVRPAWSELSAALGEARPGELVERQRQADRLLDAEGAGHLVHELTFERAATVGTRQADTMSTSRPWRLDPVPVLIAHDEFESLAAAAAQRMRALEALLDDLAGEQRCVRSGAIPPSVAYASPVMLRRSGAGRWLVHYAVDLARTAAGEWRVVQDLTDAPAGLGYALLNRSVMARIVPDDVRRSQVAPVASFAASLRRGITAQTPAGRRSPRTIVLSGGPLHPTYVEHSYLATQMGFHIAVPGDLVVRQNRVWLRVLDGVEPIDAIYRRVEDVALDPLVVRSPVSAAVPALTWAAQVAGVGLANAFGSHVVEAPEMTALLPSVAEALIGEPLVLANLSPSDDMATTPLYSGARSDTLAPGRVVVRLHAVAGPDGIDVMRGGVGRVLADGDRPGHPTARLTKDVWVVGAPPATMPTRVTYPPQVDFGASVPKRVAEALFWMGRAAERAEVTARTIRVIGGQVQQDPSLIALGVGAWSHGALSMLRAAQSRPVGREPDALAGLPLVDRLHHELVQAQVVVADQIAALVQAATSVREFLSTTTGRVLGRLTRIRADLLGADAAADDLDVVLVDLAALAGLSLESTVRGPAWRFLDLGRRIERALAVCGSLEAGIGVAADALSFQPLAESVLSANECLVAYRRRYRSDVELTAVVDLLVHDDANPRSISFQLDRLREHMASLAWREGADLVQQASVGSLTPVDDAVSSGRRLAVDGLVLAVRGPLLDLGQSVSTRWFADPINPIVMGWR
jgi:uncharacterized circularly permuted ATP-grasp superfamily protein/uncharacterized alpha-E superfamily protein